MKYSLNGHKDRNKHKNRILKKEWASSVGLCLQHRSQHYHHVTRGRSTKNWSKRNKTKMISSNKTKSKRIVNTMIDGKMINSNKTKTKRNKSRMVYSKMNNSTKNSRKHKLLTKGLSPLLSQPLIALSHLDYHYRVCRTKTRFWL